jgi:hypothetical protein
MNTVVFVSKNIWPGLAFAYPLALLWGALGWRIGCRVKDVSLLTSMLRVSCFACPAVVAILVWQAPPDGASASELRDWSLLSLPVFGALLGWTVSLGLARKELLAQEQELTAHC